MHLEGFEHPASNRTMNVEAVPNFCVSCWNTDWLASSDKCDVAGKTFSEYFVDFLFVVHRPVFVSVTRSAISVENGQRTTWLQTVP